MCGIAGNCNFAGKKVDSQSIERMIGTLVHRGPDDQGIYISGETYPNASAQVGLGHRRLSIIDLTTGRQPMANEDQSIWIVFNGEIYNFLQLKENLISKGHRFTTRSDTEVIVHLYEEEGLDCVKHLRGMFAFAIWDQGLERLFLARDRVGKKPLVYHYNGQDFIFGSEIKALLEQDIKREVDPNAIDHFLTFGYVPSPNSILKGVHKLAPGHILTFDRTGLRTQRYWRINYKKQKISFVDAKQRLKEILTESVRLRLISDVPLGAFLSGGIDSSVVVGLMSQLTSAPVKTFTIGFEEEEFSELPAARVIAKHFNTEHREFIVKPNAFEILNKLVWHYGEPFGDSSCIPSYYVAKMTRQFVPVALNGDGGDESFAGYERYRGMYLAKHLERLPKPVIKTALGLYNKDNGGITKAIAFLMDRLNIKARPRYIEGLFRGLLNYPDAWQRYLSWISIVQEDQKKHLYSKYFATQLNGESSSYIINLAKHTSASNIAEQAMDVDINSYLPEDLLVKMDIATMANSLEARSPFLDQELMEFMASVPLNFKLHALKPKHILRELVKDIVPTEILKRKKQGFGIPVDKWFRTKLKDFSYETLLDKKSIDRGYFKKEYIKSLLDEHVSGKFNHGSRIWSLMNLETWHRIFIDQSTP